MRPLLFVVAIAVGSIHAHSHAAPPRVGFLSPSTPEGSAFILAGLREGLREYGFVEGRNVMTYGPSLRDMARIAGGHVAKILNGARPADLPIEQPRNFELVINLPTAKALGVSVPQSLRLRADRLIE